MPIPHRPPELGLLASDPCPLASSLSGPRRCASCRTQRTPLWRDAEDGTPLCNACGIRSSEWRRDLGWGLRISPCLAGVGFAEEETPTSWGTGLTRGDFWAPAECWFLALPSQVQEIWYPVLQLLAGAQEKCPAQEAVWQMWGVAGSPPSPNSGRVSLSSSSRACPASVSPGEEWAEGLLGERTWVLRGAACLLSAPSPFRDTRWKTQASGPRAPGSRGHWPPPWPLLQPGLAENLTPSGNACGCETHIVNNSDNKEQNSSDKGHCDFGIPPCALSPASPLAQECGEGVFSVGF